MAVVGGLLSLFVVLLPPVAVTGGLFELFVLLLSAFSFVHPVSTHAESIRMLNKVKMIFFIIKFFKGELNAFVYIVLNQLSQSDIEWIS